MNKNVNNNRNDDNTKLGPTRLSKERVRRRVGISLVSQGVVFPPSLPGEILL